MVEQRSPKPRAEGSSPSAPAMKKPRQKTRLFQLYSPSASCIALQLYSSFGQVILRCAQFEGEYNITLRRRRKISRLPLGKHITSRVSEIFHSLLKYGFIMKKQKDLKDERHRASVQWTLATASDQAPAGARIKSFCPCQEKSTRKRAFFNEIRPCGRVKSAFGG